MANILIGLVIAACGAVVMYYSRDIVDMFGAIEWAERNVGGTSKLFVLIGFGLIILGFLFVFGVFDSSEVGNNAYDAGF